MTIKLEPKIKGCNVTKKVRYPTDCFKERVFFYLVHK